MTEHRSVPRSVAALALLSSALVACTSTTIQVAPTTTASPATTAAPDTGFVPASTVPAPTATSAERAPVTSATTGIAEGTATAATAARMVAASHPAVENEPCPEPFDATTRCGTVAVPAAWTEPDGDVLDIWFALVPAADGPATGTTLPLMGGPGEAISAVAGLFLPFSELLPDRDLLLVDVRGTGRSGRLTCSAVDELRWIPDGPDQSAVASCGQELSERISHYTTVATALDLEAVRRALGLAAPSVIGFSYGTYLGQVYTILFPDVVRSLVIDGVMPLDLEPWGTPYTDAFQRVLPLQCERVVGCDAAEVAADVRAVAASLRDTPVPFPGSARVLREGTLAYVTLFALQDRPVEYVAAVRSAADGDLQLLLQLADDALALPPADPIGASIALSPVVQCNDYSAPFSLADDSSTRAEDYRAALDALPDDQFGWFSKQGWMESGWEQGDFCLDWPDPALPPELRVPVAGPFPDVPVLVLNGDVDLQSPLESAMRITRTWPQQVQVVIAGAGHPTLPVSGCAYSLAVEVLRTATLPAPGACDGQPVVP